ncbi:hypothetical protein ACTWQB_10035 [Piscibacillus sp. B03]|uniref:hypothetical protein n=1 Tax=Piscibacillus sp. B03 TaxID=3457430 RepID=UPI003FCE39C7
MEMITKYKVNTSSDIRHQVQLINIPISFFKEKKDKYVIKLKRINDHQKAAVKVTLAKSLVEESHVIDSETTNMNIDGRNIIVFVEELGAEQKFKKLFGKYRIKYVVKANEGMSVKVKGSIKASFYENTLLPRIEKARTKEQYRNSKRELNGTNFSDDIHTKDLHYADMFQYNESPNRDGNRSRREVFGGTFSGGSRSGSKRGRKM